MWGRVLPEFTSLSYDGTLIRCRFRPDPAGITMRPYCRDRHGRLTLQNGRSDLIKAGQIAAAEKPGERPPISGELSDVSPSGGCQCF